MIVPILIGAVSLAVLVFAFLASARWHWAQVALLVTFYFSALAYALLAARSLDRRMAAQKQINQSDTQAEETRQLNEALSRGTKDPAVLGRLAAREVVAAEGEGRSLFGGVGQLEHEVRLRHRDRGRVWRDVRPTGAADAQTGRVSIAIPPQGIPQEAVEAQAEAQAEERAEAPATKAPLDLAPEAIVYVFEQEKPGHDPAKDNPRAYLGEFRVEGVSGREALLTPSDKLSLDPDAGNRLLNSEGPWILYETMPADGREVYAGLDEPALKNLLPESTLGDYLHDGQPAEPDDSPDKLEGVTESGEPVVFDGQGVALTYDEQGNTTTLDADQAAKIEKRFRRPLRDYAYLLNDLERERTELVARKQAIEADLAKLEASLAEAQRMASHLQTEQAAWADDLDRVERDLAAIKRHEEQVAQALANARRLLDETLRTNEGLAQARAATRGPLAPIGPGALDVNAL